jgi:putative nucleotidyltransferase with HDIG domain
MSHAKKRRRWILPLALAVLAGGAISAIAIFLSVTGALIAWSIVLAPLCWMLATRYGRLHRDAPASVESMGSNYEAIISLLSGALGLQDSITLSNSIRVSKLSAVVALQMGLRGDEVRLIEQAAILHDIGKLGIAEDVLAGTGELSDRDWAEMKRHPQLGFEILSSIGSLEDSAEIVWAHHERFDGQGYPRGLRGDDIPVGARIFAVVDAYVAMTSGRPYRKTLNHSMAIKEIVRNSLTQFDPQVVDAFSAADGLGLFDGTAAPAEPPRVSAKPVAAEV